MLRRCPICKDYFPQPDVPLKTKGVYRHDWCNFPAPLNYEEKRMELEMLLFLEHNPDLKTTNIPVEVKK